MSQRLIVRQLARHRWQPASRTTFSAAEARRAFASKQPPLPSVPTCPSPTCQCADMPAMPEGLEIDYKSNINGVIAGYAEQVLICTGKDDWLSKIEDENSGDNLAADLKELFGRGGKYSDVSINALLELCLQEYEIANIILAISQRCAHQQLITKFGTSTSRGTEYFGLSLPKFQIRAISPPRLVRPRSSSCQGLPITRETSLRTRWPVSHPPRQSDTVRRISKSSAECSRCNRYIGSHLWPRRSRYALRYPGSAAARRV